MKNFVLVILALFAIVMGARADECQVHSAYATSGTVTVSTAAKSSAQNGVAGYAFFNPFSCSTTGVAFVIRGTDSSTTNYYGFALVGVSGDATPGTVYANTGPVNGKAFTAAGVSNVQSLQWMTVNNPLPVGVYMLALGTTCSSSCAQLYGDASLGQFYPFIYADTGADTPWTFSSTGFSGFSSTNTPLVSIPLSTTATQNITGTLATVTLKTTYVAHIYPGATISVSGVTGSGSGLNCVSCVVMSANATTGVVEYTVPTGSFMGTVTGGTLAVSPVVVQQTQPMPSECTAGCFVAPTALIY